MGIKNVVITFADLPQNGYEPGVVLTGIVRVTTNKRTHINDLTITLQGKAKVSFYSNQVRWFKKEFKVKSSDQDLALGGIFDFDMNDIKVRRRLSDSECFRAEQIFVNTSYQLSGESYLEEGNTEFPFSIQLPNNIPSSFSSSYGHIKYKIKVKRSKPGFLSSGDSFVEEIKVTAPKLYKSLHKLNPKLLEPIVYQDVRPFNILWCSTKPFSISVSLPRTAIEINETINVDINIDNTSDININCVSLKIVKRTAWVGKYWRMKNIRTNDDVIQEINYPGIAAGEHKSWSQPVTISNIQYINIDDCSIIKIYHLIKVKAVASGIYENATVFCPLDVCDPAQSNEPQAPQGFGLNITQPPPIGFNVPSTSYSGFSSLDSSSNVPGRSSNEDQQITQPYGFRIETAPDIDFSDPCPSYSRFDSSEPPPPYPGTPEPPDGKK